MASANLTNVIAEYSSLMITLRDDISRLSNHLLGDSLTTVMGPAATAGVKGVPEILAALRGNSVLNAMTKDSANQEQILAWIVQEIQATARSAGHDAVTKAATDLKATYVESIKTLNERTKNTVVRIEAAAKLLLSGAEAKANIITRKRQEVETRFVKSLELVKGKIALINNLDRRQDQMSADLNAVSADPDVESEEMYKRITQISNGQKALANQKEIAVQCLVTHFGDQTSFGKGAKADLVNLKIPDNIEQGKGKELMANFEMYIIGRSEQYYAVMPYLQRVLEDYDHTTGACFKPPCTKESIEDIPEDIRCTYGSQSKALYGAIMAKLSDSVKCLTKATFDYGVEDKPALCADNDGPNLLFALICMFRPCNVEYTEQLESLFIDAHNTFKGADPREIIKALREPLQEAQNLQIPLKWKQCGKRIVDQLIHNDHNMSDALSSYKNLDVADKDCTAQLDKMFAAVEAQCKRNDKHEGKSNAFSTRLLKSEDQDEHKNDSQEAAQAECKFGDNCNRYPNCGFKHSKGAPKGNKSNKGSKGGKGAGSQAAKCLGVGCPDKGSKGKKLCTTCFMKACEEGELKLKDGTVFTASKPAKEGLNKSKLQTLKKAFAALIEEEENDSEDEENAPSGVGGPACSAGKKRKRAASAQAANDASKRIKDFAEGLGIDLN
jgi:hypothetical protein